jgi:hypothetical protein
MSYCRFHNTNIDLTDCIGALTERDISSQEEKRAAKNLLISILDFCEEEGIITGYDQQTIEKIISESKEQEEDY